MMLNLLEKVATALLRKHKPKVVCVTGSVGKTSTKEAIACALSDSFSVRKTSRNYNNYMGVPITVIGGIESEEGIFALIFIVLYGVWQLYFGAAFPEILIIEVGAGKVGEIKRISGWLKPDLVVITNMPDTPSHLGVFETKESIMREKKYLVDVMDTGGVLMIDKDEPNAGFFREGFDGTVIFYSGKKISDESGYQVLYREEDKCLYPLGFKMSADIGGNKRTLVFNGFIGSQNLKAIQVAIQIAVRFDCAADDIARGIQRYRPEAGRLKLIPGKTNSLCVIDDSFNASPYAVENSLETLVSLKTNPGQRKIAVLGDMHNLGSDELNIHRLTAIDDISKVDVLVTVGNLSNIWQDYNINDHSQNKHFKNSINAARYLLRIMRKGNIILFKGGHLTRLEKAIALITECDPKLLVRQEKYYRKHEVDLNPESADYDQ